MPGVAGPVEEHAAASTAVTSRALRLGEHEQDEMAGRGGPKPPSRAHLEAMSVTPIPDEYPGLTFFEPEEALRRARPLPSDAELATDDEWKAFEKALAQR
jgi:hypothetical protein